MAFLKKLRYNHSKERKILLNAIEKDTDKKYFIKRLNIIKGQISGVSKMIDEGRSYEEVLIQLGALTNSLRGLGKNVLENYMQNNIDKKNKKEVEEILNLINKLV